ncbi:hypothetical protein DFH06DRAFT_721506 [Mycena polygramma]|nr:hypothetical protein DFH06DRAFT_721506 [Mycena polygramma]
MSYNCPPGRGNDYNNRGGGGGPTRINRKKWTRDGQEGSSDFRHNDKGRTFNPAPAGIHTRFTDDPPGEGATGRKRDRSHGPEPSQSGGYNRDDATGSHGSETGSNFKRAKLEKELEEVPDSTCSSPIEEHDEISDFTSPRAGPDVAASAQTEQAQLSRGSLEPKPERQTSLFSQALKGIGGLLGAPDPAAQSHRRELEEARDTASKCQAELLQKNLELGESRAQAEELRKRLEEAEQKVCRQAPFSDVSEKQAQCRAEELDAARKSSQHYKEQLVESQEELTRLESSNQRLRGENQDLWSRNQVLESNTQYFLDIIPKNEQRMEELIKEKGALNAQLKVLRNENKAKNGEPSIDVFSHRLDQVSEATIKSGVESLNDSLDNFIMDVTDKAEQLAQKHNELVCHVPAPEEGENDPLIRALAQPDLTTENRGLLLDVRLHDQLHAELFELFFSMDVAPSRADFTGAFQEVFQEVTRREPWTVAQRWRAISATSFFALLGETDDFTQSVNRQLNGIIDLFGWAHGLPSAQFADMSDGIHSSLVALYKEANDLGLQVRRDILSVRMSVTSASMPLFDPISDNSVWPEMGAAEGDAVVGRYKFGLVKIAEDGEITYLLKPEVATTALIRVTSRND